MKSHRFPFIALGLGLVLMFIVLKGSEPRADHATSLPLLTLLIISEFAFFVTAIGAFIGFRHMRTAGLRPAYAAITVLCGILAVAFLLLGINLWPL